MSIIEGVTLIHTNKSGVVDRRIPDVSVHSSEGARAISAFLVPSSNHINIFYVSDGWSYEVPFEFPTVRGAQIQIRVVNGKPLIYTLSSQDIWLGMSGAVHSGKELIRKYGQDNLKVTFDGIVKG